MASSFSLITESEASAEELFARSLNIGLHIESMERSQERAIAGVTSGQIGLGESVTWRARHFGIWFTMTSRITALDHPHRFVDEQVSGPFKAFSHEHVFEPSGTGCRMIDTITIASPIFGSLAERLILIPYLRHLIETRNRALAAASR